MLGPTQPKFSYKNKNNLHSKTKKTPRASKNPPINSFKSLNLASDQNAHNPNKLNACKRNKQTMASSDSLRGDNGDKLGYYFEELEVRKNGLKSKSHQRGNLENLKRNKTTIKNKDKQNKNKVNTKRSSKEAHLAKKTFKELKIKTSKLDKEKKSQFAVTPVKKKDNQTVKIDSTESQSTYFALPLNSRCIQSSRISHSQLPFNKHRNSPSSARSIKSKIYKQKQRNQTDFTCKQKQLRFPSMDELKTLHQEIQQQNKNSIKFVLSQQIVKERAECLNVLSKICSSMGLKKDTYASAMCYMDNCIDGTSVKNIKVIGITSLIMAIKFNQSQKNQTELSIHNSFKSLKQLSIQSSFDDQQAQNPQKIRNSKDSNQKNSKQLKESQSWKTSRLSIMMAVLSHQQIFSEYDRILSKQEIIDMEMQINIKLNTKHSTRNYVYWISTLTQMWDSLILESHPQLKSKSTFNFHKKNLLYLERFTEILYYFPYSHYYSKVILILSVMYILIRISTEFPNNEAKGFEHFKKKLNKSTSLIFIDKAGINQIFGEYLQYLQLDMKSILSCCQYISIYLNHKIIYSNSNQFICDTVHTYNPQIFRYFQSKCPSIATKNIDSL